MLRHPQSAFFFIKRVRQIYQVVFDTWTGFFFFDKHGISTMIEFCLMFLHDIPIL